MQWSVKLADNFRLLPSGYIGIALLVLVILTTFILIIIKLAKREVKVEPIKQEEVFDLAKVKSEYIAKIDELKSKVDDNKISQRKSYNELSLIIREFVFKVTKIDVLKYTLMEAKKLGNKELIELLSEYYEPEFSKEGKGDLINSIKKTRKVISEWK